MAAVTRKMYSFGRIVPFQKVRLPKVGTKFELFQEMFNTAQLASQTEGSRCLRTSARICKIWEVPSQTEAQRLKEIYLNPKALIHDLLQPLVDCGMTVEPKIVVAPRLCGQFWRAKLHLAWPSKVTISAVHTNVAGAEENVYLLACDLFKHMGLLYQHTSGHMLPVGQDYAINLLQTLHSPTDPFSHPPPQFEFVSALTLVTLPANSSTSRTGGLGLEEPPTKRWWRTDVAAAWPYHFSISSIGPSLPGSQYGAALLTCIKLKALGLLAHNNQLAEARLPAISRRIRHQAAMDFANLSREQFDPHYEIYSDASAFGFGAYLLKKDDSRVHWLASTWTEHFPHGPELRPCQKSSDAGKEAWGAIQMDSTFCELYSVVSACYTWKHKFVGKRVLVWTDNQGVVQLVNSGVQGVNKQKRWGKLFQILSSTCRKYSIELQANHVQREENVAADFLSRRKLAAFKQVVPEAAPSQKKTKKLLFWNPLQPLHHQTIVSLI